MDPIIITIAILVGLVFLNWMFSPVKVENRNPTIKPKHPQYCPAPVESAVSEEVVPFPKQLRRAQQSLKRKQNILAEKMHEMSHERNTLTIGNLLLELGQNHLVIKDEEVQLDTKIGAFELLKKEAVLHDRERLVQIEEARAELMKDHAKNYVLKAENEIQHKALDLKMEALKVQHKDNSAQLNAIQNEHRAVLLDQDKLKNLESEALNKVRANLLKVKEEQVRLQKTGLNNIVGLIKNQLGELRLKDKEIAVNAKDAMATLRHKEVDLRKMDLQNIIGTIDNKIGQLRNQEQRIKLAHQQAKFSLKEILHNIRNEQKKLDLMRYEHALDSRQEELNLWETRLRDWEKSINEMYVIKQHYLKLESEKNNLDYREQQMELHKQYNKTQNHIERLGLQRWDNNLNVREQKLELKKLESSIRRFWLK